MNITSGTATCYMYIPRMFCLEYNTVHFSSCSAINNCLRWRRREDILLWSKKFLKNDDVNEIILISQKPWCLWVILEGHFAYLNNITHIKRFNMWKFFLIFFVKICIRTSPSNSCLPPSLKTIQRICHQKTPVLLDFTMNPYPFQGIIALWLLFH